MDDGLGHISLVKSVCDLCQNRWTRLRAAWRESAACHLLAAGHCRDNGSDQGYAVSDCTLSQPDGKYISFVCIFPEIWPQITTTSTLSTLAFGAGVMVAMRPQWHWPMMMPAYSSVPLP